MKSQSLIRKSVGLGIILTFGAAVLGAQQPPPQTMPQQQQQQGQAPLLSAQQLDDLVAPIALYPDPLLGQVLAASTYPLEVVEAQQWVKNNGGLTGAALLDAAKQQNWDPSVQALVAFPDVLARLNSDVSWTTALGNAFLAQQSDVMYAVQNMRASAEQRGKLSSSPQQTVTTETQDGQSAIQIVPANPQVIYVPSYDPYYVWGPPVYGYYPSLFYPTFGFGYWPGINIGLYFGGGWGGWGGWGWGTNWFGHGLYVNAGFFHNYGFRGGFGYGGGVGYRGGLGVSAWAHDPAHRMGVPYSNRGLSQRYGAASNAARMNASRYGAGQSYGASRGGTYAGSSYANRGAQSYANRGAQTGAQGFRGNSSAQSFGRNSSAAGSGYRSFGGNNSTAARSFNSSPAARSYSAPASRSYSAPAARSYSAPAARSFSGGGGSRSFSSGGGGGHSFGGGGGHSGGGGGHGRR